MCERTTSTLNRLVNGLRGGVGRSISGLTVRRQRCLLVAASVGLCLGGVLGPSPLSWNGTGLPSASRCMTGLKIDVLRHGLPMVRAVTILKICLLDRSGIGPLGTRSARKVSPPSESGGPSRDVTIPRGWKGGACTVASPASLFTFLPVENPVT
jgi:hypothetical protein